jgi:hypothetical protein
MEPRLRPEALDHRLYMSQELEKMREVKWLIWLRPEKLIRDLNNRRLDRVDIVTMPTLGPAPVQRHE